MCIRDRKHSRVIRYGVGSGADSVPERPGRSRSESGCRGRGAPIAQPEDIDDMSRFGESVLGRHVLRPRFDRIRFDLHRKSAIAADQVVMMVVGAARAVQALALRRLQRVGTSLGGKVGERPIDGGQSDGRAGGVQGGMEALGANKALAGAERSAHSLALPGAVSYT